jgi:hypothetical protein
MRWISVEWRCRENVEAVDPVVILFSGNRLIYLCHLSPVPVHAPRWRWRQVGAVEGSCANRQAKMVYEYKGPADP